MPSERSDALNDMVEHAHVRPAAEMLDEVEANAPDSTVVQSGVVCLRERRIEDCDAAVAAVAGLDGVEHGAIVGPVAARLNDDRPFDAKDRLQRCERLFRCIRRRVGPIGRVRECRTRAEDVAMRVTRVQWHSESRCSRIRIGGVTRSHKFSADERDAAGRKCTAL